MSVQALLDADSRTRHGKFGDVISVKEQLSDYEICSKQLASIIDIGNSMKHQLHQLIEWFKSLGIFNELCLDDQACPMNNQLRKLQQFGGSDYYGICIFINFGSYFMLRNHELFQANFSDFF